MTDLKNRLSHDLCVVARGESVAILDRGRPVAQLTRIAADDSDLESLIASGLARSSSAPMPKEGQSGHVSLVE